MQVPAQYCGRATDVRNVVRKQVRAYVRGAPWREALHGPMVSTRDVRGLIYLDGPAFSGLPLTPQIFLYMPYLEAYRHIERGELAPSSVDELREIALADGGWQLAVLLGGLCVKGYVRQPSCWPRLIRAAVDSWESLDSEGERFASRTPEGKRLWVVAGGLHYAIGGMGVRDFPMGRGIVFEPRTFLSEHGLLDKVMCATAHP